MQRAVPAPVSEPAASSYAGMLTWLPRITLRFRLLGGTGGGAGNVKSRVETDVKGSHSVLPSDCRVDEDVVL